MRAHRLAAASRVVNDLSARRWWRGALALLVAVAAPAWAGDAARGAAVFNAECSGCHSVETGKNVVGPTLAGVVGRPAGSVAGFDYSAAMRASGMVWDEAHLDRYLGNPVGTVPGIRMSYPGLRNPDRRADLISFLAAQH